MSSLGSCLHGLLGWHGSFRRPVWEEMPDLQVHKPTQDLYLSPEFEASIFMTALWPGCPWRQVCFNQRKRANKLGRAQASSCAGQGDGLTSQQACLCPPGTGPLAFSFSMPMYLGVSTSDSQWQPGSTYGQVAMETIPLESRTHFVFAWRGDTRPLLYSLNVPSGGIGCCGR